MPPSSTPRRRFVVAPGALRRARSASSLASGSTAGFGGSIPITTTNELPSDRFMSELESGSGVVRRPTPSRGRGATPTSLGSAGSRSPAFFAASASGGARARPGMGPRKGSWSSLHRASSAGMGSRKGSWASLHRASSADAAFAGGVGVVDVINDGGGCDAYFAPIQPRPSPSQQYHQQKRQQPQLLQQEQRPQSVRRSSSGASSSPPPITRDGSSLASSSGSFENVNDCCRLEGSGRGEGEDDADDWDDDVSDLSDASEDGVRTGEEDFFFADHPFAAGDSGGARRESFRSQGRHEDTLPSPVLPPQSYDRPSPLRPIWRSRSAPVIEGDGGMSGGAPSSSLPPAIPAKPSPQAPSPGPSLRRQSSSSSLLANGCRRPSLVRRRRVSAHAPLREQLVGTAFLSEAETSPVGTALEAAENGTPDPPPAQADEEAGMVLAAPRPRALEPPGRSRSLPLGPPRPMPMGRGKRGASAAESRSSTRTGGSSGGSLGSDGVAGSFGRAFVERGGAVPPPLLSGPGPATLGTAGEGAGKRPSSAPPSSSAGRGYAAATTTPPLRSRLPARPARPSGVPLCPPLTAPPDLRVRGLHRRSSASAPSLLPQLPRNVDSPDRLAGPLDDGNDGNSYGDDSCEKSPPLVVNGRLVEGVRRRRPRPSPGPYDSGAGKDEDSAGGSEADTESKRSQNRRRGVGVGRSRIVLRKSRSLPILRLSRSTSPTSSDLRDEDECASASLLGGIDADDDDNDDEEEVFGGDDVNPSRLRPPAASSSLCRAKFEESVRRKRGGANVVRAELSFAARTVGTSLRNLTNRMSTVNCASAASGRSTTKDHDDCHGDDENRGRGGKGVGGRSGRRGEGREPELKRASGCLA